MDRNFYELRLRITELFYYSFIEEKYSFLQCASKCFVSYTSELNKDNIDSVNTTFAICGLLLRHGQSLNEFRRYAINSINLYENYDKEEELTNEEKEILLEDYQEIKLKI